MLNYNDITNSKIDLASLILEDMYPNQLFEDEVRKRKAIDDINWTLLFIQEALKVNSTKIVEYLLLWFKKLFKGLNIEEYHVSLLYESTKNVLHQTFHDQEVDEFLAQVNIEDLVEINELLDENPYHQEMDEYLNALLTSDRSKALQIIREMVDQKIPIQDIYLYVFQETMRHVGALWHNGKIQVGREHYCTIVTQYIMSTLYAEIFTDSKKDKKIMACTVGSELHEMGIRMVADIFELNGWDTNYLGPNLPAEEIVKYAIEYNPDIIALSITMPYHISTLKDTIQVIRNNEYLRDTKIMIGGVPFLHDELLYKKVGADAYAKDAKEGIMIANELLHR
jgi:methanogenic corrinoid protein MtbC1